MHLSNKNWFPLPLFCLGIVMSCFCVRNFYSFSPSYLQLLTLSTFMNFLTFILPSVLLLLDLQSHFRSIIHEELLPLTRPIFFFSSFYSFPLSVPVPQLISPESQGNDHKSNPCAWMSIHEQSSRWGHFHLGKKGCHGCCHVACAEPGRAGHAAGTERCSRPPSPPHCVPLERRCCGGWQRCSAPSGWCGEGSSAQPR